jgi:sulfopyruvate decarboxylase subunit alpha
VTDAVTARGEAFARRTPRPPATYKADVARRMTDVIRANGVDFAVLVPDSVLHAVDRALMEDPAVTSIVCSREDEGIAIAMGAAWGGRKAAVLMEGSGLGYSSLILARGIVQRTGVLLIVSHNSNIGERFSYHAATRLVAEPTLRALGVPYHVLLREDDIETVFTEMLMTMRGQRLPVAIVVPRHICVEG